MKNEKHTVIIPYDGYTTYHTNWGTSGSEPNCTRTSKEVVNIIPKV